MVKVVNPTENFRGMSCGEWCAVWSNWLYSSYPRYFPDDDIIFLRGFLEYFDPQSEYSTRQFITEQVVAGRRSGDPPDLDSKYKDIVRTTERRQFLNKVMDRDETFTGDVIPEQTAVFIPIVTAMYWLGETYEGRHLESELDVRRAVRTDTHESNEIWAWHRNDSSSDWKTIVEPDKLKPNFYVESPMFTLRVSEESPFIGNTRVQSGSYDTVVGGYVIIIPELPKGKSHHIRFGARGRDNYRTESQYLIKVDGQRRDFIKELVPPELKPIFPGYKSSDPKDITIP